MRFRLSLTLLVLTVPAAADEPTLPRVLILGDSVYRQPATETAKALKDQAVVKYATAPSGEVFHSGWVLNNLDELLGGEDWDIIHLNVGLGDLIHRVPGLKSFRVLSVDAGGVRSTTEAEYERNLRQIIAKLQATEATIIWATTTPIRHSSTGVFEKGSELRYNRVANRVMTDRKVMVTPMYRHVLSVIDMGRPAGHGADPFSFDRKPIHAPIVRSILTVIEPTAARNEALTEETDSPREP